jgi:5,10-methenyltetrahydrofolate synthetase
LQGQIHRTKQCEQRHKNADQRNQKQDADNATGRLLALKLPAIFKPDALLIPLVGFDAEAYRLGYGGGYYDRTLATFARKPFCIGVGDAEAEIASIRPQPHDIPMDVVVTDRALQFPPR